MPPAVASLVPLSSVSRHSTVANTSVAVTVSRTLAPSTSSWPSQDTSIASQTCLGMWCHTTNTDDEDLLVSNKRSDLFCCAATAVFSALLRHPLSPALVLPASKKTPKGFFFSPRSLSQSFPLAASSMLVAVAILTAPSFGKQVESDKNNAILFIPQGKASMWNKAKLSTEFLLDLNQRQTLNRSPAPQISFCVQWQTQNVHTKDKTHRNREQKKLKHKRKQKINNKFTSKTDSKPQKTLPCREEKKLKRKQQRKEKQNTNEN